MMPPQLLGDFLPLLLRGGLREIYDIRLIQGKIVSDADRHLAQSLGLDRKGTIFRSPVKGIDIVGNDPKTASNRLIPTCGVHQQGKSGGTKKSAEIAASQ